VARKKKKKRDSDNVVCHVARTPSNHYFWAFLDMLKQEWERTALAISSRKENLVIILVFFSSLFVIISCSIPLFQ
jgi:hypothetical protein